MWKHCFQKIDNKMIDLDGLAVYAKVVELGSFTAAADVLGMSKSAVSKQVSKLEERLGAQLLRRTTRRLNLTEVGEAFYERCRRIVSEAEEAELAVTRLQDEPRGILRVNAPVSFGMGYLANALPDFMRSYPEVTVDIAFADRRVDLIEEGVDVAIRIGRLEDSTLIARRITDVRRAVVASPEYWERYGRPETPSDLLHHNCLTYEYFALGNNWQFVDPKTGENLLIPIKGSLHSNNGSVLAQAAIAGIGVIHMPLFMVPNAFREGRLESVLDEWMDAPIGLHAVYPSSRHLSAKVRAFVDFLVSRYSGPLDGWAESRDRSQ